MREALELAARGQGRVSPNPMVGAVLVKSGRVVGRGFHRRFGGPHAEVEAIRDAGERARGGILYVTMEPCCFHGKTPACTGAVELAGIRRVVAATLDPNPRVSGRGMRCLREGGVAVTVGLLGAAARRLNEAYVTFYNRQRPFVVLKVAATLDGMVATESGESQWITGAAARRAGHRLRERADAILVGVNTVLRDDPLLTCRTMKGKRLLRVVLDSRLRLLPAARLLGEPGPVLVFTSEPNAAKSAELRHRGAEVVGVRLSGPGRLRWADVLAELHRREVQTLLVEGGATVAGSALEHGVVDKLVLFQAATVMGPGRPFSSGMRERSLGGLVRLSRVERRCLGADMMVEGYVHRVD